jgi:integration host factor subunit beta
MAATTKRDLVKRISAETNTPRPVVRQIVQQMLDDIVDELAHGHRLEFRDFGVFETVKRKKRVARNPRTGLAVQVPAKTVAHFKQGRIMKQRVAAWGEKLESSETTEQLPPANTEEMPAESPGLP